MQPVEYYQIGGYGAHWRGASVEDAASRLMQMGPEGAEFVLGIRPNGASALLLPCARFRALRLGHPTRDWPRRASEFEALSPIAFGARRALADKLKRLASTKRPPKGAPARDLSQANRQYTVHGDVYSEEGRMRGAFEHQRVLYRLWQGTVGNSSDYALSPAPWLGAVRVYSFAFNTWAMDHRDLRARQGDPRVLDVGWTEFDPPSDEDDLRAVSTTHLMVEEDEMLGNPGRTRLRLPDVTQVMPREEIAKSLQSLFAPSENAELNGPKILLVHNLEWARCILRNFGVDMSRWEVGIKNLLYHYGGPTSSRSAYGSTREPYNQGGGWKKERSRSPPRRQGEYGGTSFRSRSPAGRKSSPEVYLVDIREMYHCVMHVPPDRAEEELIATAKALGVKDTIRAVGADDGVTYEDIDPKMWCAGKESRLLGFSWEAMALASAVDEQASLRMKFEEDDAAMRKHDAAMESARRQGRGAEDDDEERDPNDIMTSSSNAGPAAASGPSGLFNSDDEDDDWNF